MFKINYLELLGVTLVGNNLYTSPQFVLNVYLNKQLNI